MLGLAVYLRMWRRSKAYDPRTGKRIGGVRRVIAYGIVMSLVIGLVALKKAEASSAEAIKGLSRDLLSLKDVLGDGSSLRINGETVHVAVTPTKGSVKETLDRVENNCKENAGVLGSLSAGIARSGNDDEGAVVCIVRSESSPKDLAAALQEFSRTQDLGAIGKMRYVYAKRIPKGGAQLMTAWTDERFSFNALSPSSAGGDAPGADSAIVPRLPGSRRLLTAEVQGTSYAVRIYSVPGSVAEVLARYDTLMKERGFVPLRGDPRGERGYLLDGLLVTMVAEAAESGVTVSFAELGSNAAH